MSEFKDALDWCSCQFRGRTVYDGHPIQVIERALRIADRLMQEPSEGMVIAMDAAWVNGMNFDQVFKDGAAQLMREIDNADGENTDAAIL